MGVGRRRGESYFGRGLRFFRLVRPVARFFLSGRGRLAVRRCEADFFLAGPSHCLWASSHS
jgi:hypothetical protein